MQEMTHLYLAALAFMAIHLVISGTGMRQIIVNAIGERIYLALFSLASLGAISWLAMSYNGAALSAENDIYWLAPVWLTHLGPLVLLAAFLLAVPGLLTPNPTSVGQEQTAEKENAVQGMVRITRHPFLWGVILWAAFHLAVNGDRASQTLFGTFLTVALVGTFSIDAKRARKMGESWRGFARQTSNVPFSAILRGRSKIAPGETFREIGWWRLAAAVAVWAAVLLTHEMVFGVTPFG